MSFKNNRMWNFSKYKHTSYLCFWKWLNESGLWAIVCQPCSRQWGPPVSALNWSLAGEKPELQGDKKYYSRSMTSSLDLNQVPEQRCMPSQKVVNTMVVLSMYRAETWKELWKSSPESHSGFSDVEEDIRWLATHIWAFFISFSPFSPFGPIRELYFRTFSHHWAGRACLSISCKRQNKTEKPQQQLCSKLVGQVSLCYHEDRLGERRREGH